MGEAETLDVETFGSNRARQVFATLDRDGPTLHEGDPLPRECSALMRSGP